MKRSKTGLKRLVDATGNSIKGIRACWKHEAAFRQNVGLALVLFVASFFLASIGGTVVAAGFSAVALADHRTVE